MYSPRLCASYDPDDIFKLFKLVDFPPSFIGLSTVQDLDVQANLVEAAYLKTSYDGRLMKFEEACKMSPSHRAFNITMVNNHTIRITYKPLNECVSGAKKQKQHLDNRFVFDLRLIKVDGVRCCHLEDHAEIGRFYVSGEYELCNISHHPKTVVFGQVVMGTKVTKHVRIRNESKSIAAKFFALASTGYVISPEKFILPPSSSIKITFVIKPTCLQMSHRIQFIIRNSYDEYDDSMHRDLCLEDRDDNFILYEINTELQVKYSTQKKKEVVVESMHKLREQNPCYTYLGKELQIHKKRREKAFSFLEQSKSAHVQKTKLKRFSGMDHCYPDNIPVALGKAGDFCATVREYISPIDIFNILCLPHLIDFGRIAVETCGENILTIKNNTKYDIGIKLQKDAIISYTIQKLTCLKIKLKSYSETTISLVCNGFVEGYQKGTFSYTIDNKYHLKHSYSFHVGNSTLMVLDRMLKFGMVTSETFVTSVPLKLFNNFNVDVPYEWEDLNSDIPFEIIPKSGTVPKHSSKLCDISYLSKPTKTKTHEIELISLGNVTKTIPIELNIVTRKLTIKFMQQAAVFKDIPLNLETIESVKMENSSREIALFYVLEPILPGIKIEPMSGTIRPKMIMTFVIKVKICCIMDFSFDIYVRINNKENISFSVMGNVVEPKISIQPKNIYMPRVPCHMVTYIPLTVQNTSTVKSVIEVLDTGDENIFNVYIAQGNEKQRLYEFTIESGQTKTIFVKVFDIFRREYDMYIPFKINGLLGPPTQKSSSLELKHYIGEYEQWYDNNFKVKLKNINKDISYCRIIGVITVPWVQFSIDRFEIEYAPVGSNSISFTMTNVSRYILPVTIVTSKLSPYFTLHAETSDYQSLYTENNIKFELQREQVAELTVKFHPKGHGRFVSIATLYLDKAASMAYYNLTFVGKRQTPDLTPDTHRLIFPPCYVGLEISRDITLKYEAESDLEPFTCSSKEEPNLNIKFLSAEICGGEDDEYITLVKVRITVSCSTEYVQNIVLGFHHECGSFCDIEVNFIFTQCPLTLHTKFLVSPDNNPYPYYPLSDQVELFNYLETCTSFLEKWMFQQGFRRDLFPVIPDTFHAISSAMTGQVGLKSKGINVSYLSFIRRIAGPLMKHIRKISVVGIEEPYRSVKEIYDTYREITILLRSRGVNLWTLKAKFLLSYDQFKVYNENVTGKVRADMIMTQELLSDEKLFNRLNKQTWIDFILQTYKVFVLDSCFFDCVCVNSQNRDIVAILINWYNEQISLCHNNYPEYRFVKLLTNLTSDLCDGGALICTFINFCPFLAEHFSIHCIVKDNKEEDIISNACLIIDALNQLKLYFPLKSNDFLKPNFLQMLFLAVHLYITLPMFNTKDTIRFNPPLLRSSTRQVGICPMSQETLTFTYSTLNNNSNCFSVDKSLLSDGKKMYLNVKYTANFVTKFECILLIHGYNKTRIFDTYIIFVLCGQIGSLNPLRKCKVTGPLYRPVKVDVLLSSPFSSAAMYKLQITDIEPNIPVQFEEIKRNKFFVRRLNLIETEMVLNGLPKDQLQQSMELLEQKLVMQLICLSTQVGTSWVWFRSDVGEFFIKITTQPRWDMAIDTLQCRVKNWPIDPCSCGEACECYRTTILMIPHRNEFMVKSLRYALLENASEAMMHIFDELIESGTGKIILRMLLCENGTNISEISHILKSQVMYRITSRALLPRIERIMFHHHTDSVLALPVTIPPQDKSEKFSVTFTSECGMDVRTYRVLFIEDNTEYA